ncbi:MAG: hypothetical protein F4057_01090 [Acidobacteria bacterium]|nr:hypothetical protein [Acidobacteriota bacterium]
MHWTGRWLLRRFPDDFDCADFVRCVLEEQFGQAIELPSARAAGVRGRDAQIAAGAGALADPVAAPREGDGVLMRAIGRQRSVGHHLGVWCEISGGPHVLHLLGVVRTPCLNSLADVGRIGLETTGVYRWR